MGYQEALEAAGATVHEIEYFGSYQGDWLARVTYNGVTGYVHGWFGSCSYCDGFEAEFGYGYEDARCDRDEHRYERTLPACNDCLAAFAKYNDRLVAFGEAYLDDIKPYSETRRYFEPSLEWDTDAHGLVAWLDKTEMAANVAAREN